MDLLTVDREAPDSDECRIAGAYSTIWHDPIQECGMAGLCDELSFTLSTPEAICIARYLQSLQCRNLRQYRPERRWLWLDRVGERAAGCVARIFVKLKLSLQDRRCGLRVTPHINGTPCISIFRDIFALTPICQGVEDVPGSKVLLGNTFLNIIALLPSSQEVVVFQTGSYINSASL